MRGDSDSVTAYMPWWLGDYHRDTADLDCLEHGAYLQLLGELWTAGGFLPFEPGRLARRINLRERMWDSVWSTICRFFTVDERGLSQKRLLYELEQAREMRSRRSSAGRFAAASRYANRSAIALPIALRSHEQTHAIEPSNACHSPSPSDSPEEKIPPKGPPRGAARVKSLREPVYPEAFELVWAGCDRVGQKAHALKAWRQVGEPSPELVILAWTQWRTVAWPDGIGTPYVATWLRAFSWKEQPVAPPGRKVANGVTRHVPPPVSALEAYCEWHRDPLHDRQPANRSKPSCPSCKHLAAMSRPSGDSDAAPVAIGDVDALPGWSR